MRIFLVAWTTIVVVLIHKTSANGRVFRDVYQQRFVEAAQYPPIRIHRSSVPREYSPTYRSRVFRNVQISSSNDEPRLYRASGRFNKRVHSVPTHGIDETIPKEAAFSYDEEKHHNNKLSEDNQTMIEAHEFARGMQRTTVAVKTDPITVTTPMTPPSSTNTQKHEFKQPPAAFVHPAPHAQRMGSNSRTFVQTVGGKLSGPPTIIGGAEMPPHVPTSLNIPTQNNLLIPQLGRNPNSPKEGPNTVVPQLPNLPHIPQQVIPTVAPLLPPGFSTANPLIPNQLIPNNVQQPPPQIPPQITAPVLENRFEVINGQAANSSLEQLGCGFDWITNSCKDVFALGWCGRCHDFGNIFLHDCKCIQPLIPLPVRPQPTRPTPSLIRLFNY